jgi:preprotein translocase subunit SecB
MSAIPENTQSTDPVFMLQRCYLKDLSLEQPNSPQILLEQQQPNVDVQMSVEAKPVVDGLFEIIVAATITARMQERVLFLVEGKQAGIFELRNIPQEHADMLLGIACPQTVYPYLRANLADAITRAGFPPVHLAEINFQAMYEQQQAQQQAANDAPSIITTPDRLN